MAATWKLWFFQKAAWKAESEFFFFPLMWSNFLNYSMDNEWTQKAHRRHFQMKFLVRTVSFIKRFFSLEHFKILPNCVFLTEVAADIKYGHLQPEYVDNKHWKRNLANGEAWKTGVGNRKQRGIKCVACSCDVNFVAFREVPRTSASL